MYGNKKEGADWAYNNTWSYSGLYGTLAETGDLLYLGLREGYRHTSYGMKEVLPGTIERVGKHFRELRMRADSGYYSQALVRICEDREVEYFIPAFFSTTSIHELFIDHPQYAFRGFRWNPFMGYLWSDILEVLHEVIFSSDIYQEVHLVAVMKGHPMSEHEQESFKLPYFIRITQVQYHIYVARICLVCDKAAIDVD